jgi:hypothetical protein
MENLQEKRREERFMLEVPVQLENGRGMSRDISESGIFFTTDQPFSPGGIVKFSVKLTHLRRGKPVKLDCQGQVVRVERIGENFGVAASITQLWCVN